MRTESSLLIGTLLLIAALQSLGQPVIMTQPQSQLVGVGTAVTLSVEVAGVEPIIFQWRTNGVNLPGRTSANLLITNAQPADGGSYTVVAANESGAVTSQVAVVTVDVPVSLLTITNRWKFNQSGDVPANWKDVQYDDSTWPEGDALFFNESAALPAPKQTMLELTNARGEPIITYYFRTHFNFTGSTDGLSLVTTSYVDDGAVFHLNGMELGRLRMPAGVVTATTRAFAGVEAQAEVLRLPAGALVQGDNVLAVEVHQENTTIISNADVVFGMSLVATRLPPPMPDLILWGPAVSAHFETRTFFSNDCEVLEGCAIPGTRRLLRFATETRNTGTADLILGAPAGNPLFVFDSCHGHYHFEGYVDFRLVDSNGVVAATGKKIGFALVDGERWDTTNGPPVDHYDESYQGIQRGWSDLYDYLLPCQFLDITDVAPGLYTMELEVDPENKIPELDESNNVTRVIMNVPANAESCSAPPTNDLFASAQIIHSGAVTVFANTDCATREAGEPLILNNPGGRSVWFRWTAPYSGGVTIDTEGSNFDTLMGLYRGTELDSLTLITADDDRGAGRTSRIVTNVTAGTVYLIAVDGYYFASAGRAYSGNLVLNVKPVLQLMFPSHAGNTFQFIVTAHAADRYLIETSSNLVTWTPWRSVTNAAGSLLIMDSLSVGSKFYRARIE